MLEQAAPALSCSIPALRPEQEESSNNFKCDHCENIFKTKQELSVHIGQKHKELKKPEALCEEVMNKSLDMSLVSDDRENISFLCDMCDFQGDSNVGLKIHMNKTHRDITTEFIYLI